MSKIKMHGIESFKFGKVAQQYSFTSLQPLTFNQAFVEIS